MYTRGMTAPIVTPVTRKIYPPEYLEDPWVEHSHLVAVVRRDWVNPPKGQLWERLAEVKLRDVIHSPAYFSALNAATCDALDRAFERDEAAGIDQ